MAKKKTQKKKTHLHLSGKNIALLVTFIITFIIGTYLFAQYMATQPRAGLRVRGGIPLGHGGGRDGGVIVVTPYQGNIWRGR